MLKTLNPAPGAGAGRIRGSSWRTLLSPPLTGAENMACDVALMERARATGEAVVRVYSWTAPTLSFGRNQKTAGYDPTRLAQAGIDVVRRPTGGRAILHHREITYSVTAPVDAAGSIADEYSWINALLVRALRAMGVPAEIAAPAGRAPAPDAKPCFASATAGEITAGGRKLVGSAQYREAGSMLQHGSVLVEDDQSAISALSGAARPSQPATLHAALGRAPQPRELYESLGAVMAEDGVRCEPLTLEATEDSMRLHIPTFENPEWTWRR
ncbi:MAG: hypothetical protein H0W42_10580 [Gemmatimonadaceae bacterium]|nr:hypothetical protein [Gemmatimonadaceae bacterium]